MCAGLTSESVRRITFLTALDSRLPYSELAVKTTSAPANDLSTRRQQPEAMSGSHGGQGRRSHAYLDEMYFSRRICGTGRPYSFSAVKAASTMLGLPQR